MFMHAQQAYLEGEVLCADPLQLVRILYRAALESIQKARHAVSRNKIADRGMHIVRTSEILNELTLSVDRAKGGEVAGNLVELYDYLQRLLQEANFRNLEAPLEEAERLVALVLDGWENCSGTLPEDCPLPAIPPREANLLYSARPQAY
jgi:flagellar secretion chaperone FliS